MGLPQIPPQMVWHFRALRKSFPERFGVSAHGESRFPNGLEFPRLAKVVSRMVWSFRAWRKSFPEWFGISAHGESCFPNSLEFPRMAKVISRMVCDFRAWRKYFPEYFCACGPPANQFQKVLTLRAIKQKSINKRISEKKERSISINNYICSCTLLFDNVQTSH